LFTLSEAAEKIGFRTLGVKLSLKKLLEAPLPCVLHRALIISIRLIKTALILVLF